MNVQKEISLRNAISYCIENNDVNTATNRIMEFIRDEKEAINFIRCCEQLKGKKVMSFEEYVDAYYNRKDFKYFNKRGKSFKCTEILQIYDEHIHNF